MGQVGGYMIVFGAMLLIAGFGTHLSVWNFGDDRPGDTDEGVRATQAVARWTIKVGAALILIGVPVAGIAFLVDQVR